jgi:sugar lactone lactonase YvrE
VATRLTERRLLVTGMFAGDLEVLEAAPSHHGESPLWDSDAGVLHWVDLTQGFVHHLSANGTCTSHEIGTEIGAIALHIDGGLVAATTDGFSHLAGDQLRCVAGILAQQPGLRMNDGACDRAGRFLAGSMSYDGRPQVGSLHRLELDGRVSTLIDGVTIPNGLDWSPDGSLLYFTDSAARVVTAYDYDHESGAISRPRLFLDFAGADGEPDGLTVDSAGNVWVALWDGWEIRCYSPDAHLLDTLPVPVQRPTSVAFGGGDLRDLYITTSRYGLSRAAIAAQPAAGRLLRQRTAVVGRSPDACKADLTSPLLGAG